VETSELFVDNLVGQLALCLALQDMSSQHEIASGSREPLEHPMFLVQFAAACAADESMEGLLQAAAQAAAWYATVEEARTAEQAAQANIVRDIFGPLPFRKVEVDPAWLAWNDGTVKRLAEAAYAERSLPKGNLDRVQLTILADALEEAGCTNEEILWHLREPVLHVRGCWAIDLLTSRV
jgi:hypothetical protein